MQNRMLKYVLSVMKEEENQAEWRRYCGELKAEGICCLERSAKGQRSEPGVLDGLKDDGYLHTANRFEDGCCAGNTLVLTDDESTAERCARQGIACIGYCPPETVNSYFPHVQMVWESFEGIRLQDLEQFFCRFHGFPMVIARTGRLLLRESQPGDFDTLRRMEQEAGWSFEVTETREKYLSYLKFAYSFYGYGYWTAELLENGRMIGWCGFSGWGVGTEDPELVYMKIENPLIGPEMPKLELGYLVDAAYRRQGLALEMCRAALAYAFEELGAGTVWVKIVRKNKASLRLAEKLGFTEG